jgi:hypothetical protein
VHLFVENPFWLVFLGAICCLTPLLLWSNTGERVWLRVFMILLLGFSAWLGFERWYETDRESLFRSVYHYRDLVRSNRIEELQQHMSPELRGKIQSDLGKYTFVDCGVSNMAANPTFNYQGDETQAEIHFVASATVRELGSSGPIKVRLFMRKVGPGKWVVTRYEGSRLGSKAGYVDSFDKL